MSIPVARLGALLVLFAVLASSAVAANVTPRSGSFKGKTEQKGPIVIRVVKSRHRVAWVSLGFVCEPLLASGERQYDHTFHGPFKIKQGKLEIHTRTKDDRYAIDLTARFTSATKVKGTVDAVGPQACLSPKLDFTAKHPK
jgi:hypothetical protein